MKAAHFHSVGRICMCKKEHLKSSVSFMQCFHCPGKNKRHAHIQATVCRLHDFGDSTYNLKLLYMPLKLSLYRTKTNSETHANNNIF